MNENHPVLFAMDAQLRALREAYDHDPSDHNRYHLVRLESLIQQWAPEASAVLD